MAGYGAVVSLQQTIERILESSRISLDPPSAEIIQLVCRELKSLRKILKRLDGISPSKSRKKVNALDGRIKEAVWRFEDLLESHLSHHFLSHHLERDSDRVLLFSIDLLQNDVSSSFIETVKDRQNKYDRELDNMPQVEGNEDVNASTSRSSSGGIKGKKVGLSDLFEDLKSFLMKKAFTPLSFLRISKESHLSQQILSHHFERESDLPNDVGSFVETVKDMKNEYLYELDNMPQLGEDEESPVVPIGGMKVKMVGFSDYLERVKKYLIGGEGICLCSLVGMPGSGKTTLAENVFGDLEVSRWFDHRVWITVGRKYELREIKRHILAQLDPHIDEIPQEYDKTGEILEGKMERKRCLIVLDNIWDKEVLDYLRSLLPVENNAVVLRILLTTNIDKVAEDAVMSLSRSSFTITLQPLNEKESEDLFRMKVFGEEVEDFPPRLEKAAKKIAKNCKGFPLMIVTVADLLSKSSKNDDPDFWNEVAENRNSDVMMVAHDQISKVLFPVYDCSPQSSKMFYLYMGVFPQDSEIPASKLTNMLTVEGFLKLQKLHKIFDSYWEFNRMVSSTIITSQRKSVNSRAIKNCHLNSSWCHLFNKESCKDKFLLLLNSGCVDALEQCMEGQRRLCLHANFVFNFKEVYNSVKSNCSSTVRSLLCFGPYHPYSMPLDVGFKLLRVLDALKVHFYTFPVEILELILLQYLALTYNGELPTSISKLFNLRFLIILPHVSIKYWGITSYVPVQIWDMQELEHIEISGRNLPNPEHNASLQKLLTLLGVSIHSCTREVLEGLPNIKKLGIQIKLTNSGDDDLNFEYIWKLKSLEILKCSGIVNPEVKYGGVAPQKPISMFPSRLRKLHLSGMGYPWKYMKAVGEIPNLQVLKLRCYAFQGPKWETENNSFLHLKYLVIEDTDLVQWKPRRGSFPNLDKLRMKHCYKLQEFNWPYDSALGGMIELVDCNPLAVTCAKQLEPTCGWIVVLASFDGQELN